MNAFYENMCALLESIEDCLDKRRILPCLTLLYSGIDVVASLERKPKESTQSAFVRWVDGYLLKARQLPCTGLDLYAARCGILHTFTADSDLLKRGRVRRVLYAWGTADAKDLADVANIVGRSDVAIHVRELVDGFREGLAEYLESVNSHPERMQKLEAGTSLWFTHLDQDLVKKLLEASKRR